MISSTSRVVVSIATSKRTCCAQLVVLVTSDSLGRQPEELISKNTQSLNFEEFSLLSCPGRKRFGAAR